MTLREFAERIGCDPGYLSKVENGKSKKLSRPFLKRVYLATKTNPEWLLSGKGGPFISSPSDEALADTLLKWSEKRSQRIFAVLHDLHPALDAASVIGHLFEEYSLTDLKEFWDTLRREVYPQLPAPGREFWNEVYSQLLDGWLQAEDKRTTNELTDTETLPSVADVKPKLPSLLERLKKATAETGKKSELAEFLKAPLASVSRWLSGEREPGGEVALQMLHWVEQQERKK